MPFDVDKIINGTPVKRIKNGYRMLQESFSKDSAQLYYDIYSVEPLSALYESSRLIFCEPYQGLQFFEEMVCDVSNCQFLQIKPQYEKFMEYLSESADKMVPEQKSRFEHVQHSLETLLETTKNTRIYAQYIKEHVDENFEEKLSSLLYEYKSDDNNAIDDIITLFKEAGQIAFMTYAPYIGGKLSLADNQQLNQAGTEMLQEAAVEEESAWRTHSEKVICGNKLLCDPAYMSEMGNLARTNRYVIEHYGKSSLLEDLNSMISLKQEAAPEKVSPSMAVNNIFYAMQESAIFAEDYAKMKERFDVFRAIAYECTMDTMITEYNLNMEAADEQVTGYTLLEDAQTLSEAYMAVSSKLSTIDDSYFEKEEDEDEAEADTEDIEEEEDEKEPAEPDTGDEGGNGASSKKPQAPKPKNVANSVQFKAMDAEVKHNKKKAIRQQKGQERRNAVKAVTAVPEKAIKDTKEMIRKLDEMDDERRKNFMTEPGFRKRAFKNLKLAILYGSAAYTKLALVPVTMLARKFSKEKDIRIRNELRQEIQTEIAVCEEKIQDANAYEDKTEKYRLMRIKARLEAELTRVTLNSKYV